MGQDAERGVCLDGEGEAEAERQDGPQGVDAATNEVQVVDVKRGVPKSVASALALRPTLMPDAKPALAYGPFDLVQNRNSRHRRSTQATRSARRPINRN